MSVRQNGELAQAPGSVSQPNPGDVPETRGDCALKTVRNLGRCGLLSVSVGLEEEGLGGGKDWGRFGCALLSPNPVPLSSLPLPAQRCRQGHLSAK